MIKYQWSRNPISDDENSLLFTLMDDLHSLFRGAFLFLKKCSYCIGDKRDKLDIKTSVVTSGVRTSSCLNTCQISLHRAHALNKLNLN